MSKALGLIETIGLVPAIEAADAAVKAANVTLLGYESARGSGKITIKLTGDVGAVKAAVSAGVAAAERIGKVYGQLVIPRPHQEIDELVGHVDRGRAKENGAARPEPAPAPEAAAPQQEPDATAPGAPEAGPDAGWDLPSAPESQGGEPDVSLDIPAAEPPVAAAPEAQETRPDLPGSEQHRCEAITQAGEPCKLPARPGSHYCSIHRKLETAG